MNKEKMIDLWIENALSKTKNVNKNASSSYGLKHFCEESIGVYVSNDEMKNAMIDFGFISDKKGVNWHFNISKKINRIIFKNKLSNLYSDKNRVFTGKEIFIENV